MGSERLSHAFAAKDPTCKVEVPKPAPPQTSSSTNDSSHHSESSAGCGTHPCMIAHKHKSCSSSSSKNQTKTKDPNSNSNHQLQLYARQLAQISTTLHAIHSLGKPSTDYNSVIVSSQNRVKILEQNLGKLHNSPSDQQIDQMKNDIDELIADLKSYKLSNEYNTTDLLVNLPSTLSESDENDGTSILNSV